MQDSRELQTTESGQQTDGDRSNIVHTSKFLSASLKLAGKQFGKLTVTTGVVIKRGKHPRIEVRCQCGAVSAKEYYSVINAIAGCRKCGNPIRIPRWLYGRANSAQQRCTNPNDLRFQSYGGRGIKFRFESPLEMALWVQENLGLHKDMVLDRKDNDGHYEPGNLRYLTNQQNICNSRRKRNTAEMHAFRAAHPEVRYADSTIMGMFSRGMSWEEIVDRYHKPSCKPKGVYGTFSTPDPAIASLRRES